MKNNRREFVKLTGMAGLALVAAGITPSKFDLILANSSEKEVRFISPIDGDMLNQYDGTVADGILTTAVKIAAPAGSRIKVNGVNAKYIDGIFKADIRLKNYENIIEMVEKKEGYKKSIKVFWLKNYVNKYRFSLDDNILFLKDISNNADRYKSIFENPYLGFLKHLHDTYNTKIHLNIFYETDSFNLSQMTDKFKNEWKINSGWLGLSFHALGNTPDKPYINADYNQVKKECALVDEQIRRFAGEEVMGPETTLHWGEATVEGCRALRDSGYTVLAGYFNVDDNQSPVSYYLNEEQRRHIKNRFIWRDNSEKIIFARIAIVINNVKLEQIVPYLNNVKKTFNPRYLDLMIHEQYYYPDYVAYQPDWKEKVMTAVKWAVDNGYNPGFLKESVFE
jgi:hypothetical protein